MALLDKANTSTYGNPKITQVNMGARNNPASRKLWNRYNFKC
jgi:hydroxylamine reductase